MIGAVLPNEIDGSNAWKAARRSSEKLGRRHEEENKSGK